MGDNGGSRCRLVEGPLVRVVGAQPFVNPYFIVLGGHLVTLPRLTSRVTYRGRPKWPTTSTPCLGQFFAVILLTGVAASA